MADMAGTADTAERRFAMLVGLEVTDDAVYARYRAAMKPILHRMGGAFTCDFRVSEVLAGDVTGAVDPRVNRVFALSFPDASARDAFFGDPEYLAAKREFFERSVGAVVVLGEYQSV